MGATFVDILADVKGILKPKDLDNTTADKIEKKASKILTTITDIGMIVSILILVILGFKYMLGSVEEKAEYKKDLVPYFVGACLIFGITTFVEVFMKWGETISKL